jgi:hypothetical protein
MLSGAADPALEETSEVTVKWHERR